MATTTQNALPTPELSEAANVPLDMQELATQLDSRLVPRFASAAARDAAITSPVEGQLAHVSGVHGMTMYVSGAWRSLSGGIQESIFGGAVSTTSGGYTTIGGPSVSLSVLSGQQLKITHGAWIRTNNTGARARMSWAISGAITLAASDAWAIQTNETNGATSERTKLYTATASGSITITGQYRSGGATCYVEQRYLVVEPRW